MIHIVYEPLLAGKLIALVITAFTKENFKQFEIYDKDNDGKRRWTQREGDFEIDPDIEFLKGHHFPFKDFMNYENMVFISCKTQKEKELAESRVAHVKHGIMNNPYLIDIRFKYLTELLHYLRRNNKDLFEIPYSHIWDIKKFPETMSKCLEWLGLTPDKEKIAHAQKVWLRSNIIQKSKLTDEERVWWK